jgi:hypothetical protein
MQGQQARGGLQRVLGAMVHIVNHCILPRECSTALALGLVAQGAFLGKLVGEQVLLC